MPTRHVSASPAPPSAPPSPAPRTAGPRGPLAAHPALVATETAYGRGAEIYGEGEPADYVYQIVVGVARTYKLLNDGRRQIGAFHLPGDVFGLESLAAHRMTAEAVTETTLRVVRRRALECAAETDVGVARELWRLTARELRHAEDHMLLLGRKTAAESVATFLLEMDRRLSVAGMLALPMGRRDIADYLGLTHETVSRTLSLLHARGMLAFCDARHITLRDRARLAAIGEVTVERAGRD